MKVVSSDKAIAVAKALQVFDNYAQVNSHENLAMLLAADDPVAEVTNLKNQVMESFDELMKAAVALKADSTQQDDLAKEQAALASEKQAFEKEKGDFLALKSQTEAAKEASAEAVPGPASQPGASTKIEEGKLSNAKEKASTEQSSKAGKSS